MKPVLILGIILAAPACVLAQESGNAVFFQSAGPVTVAAGMVGKASATPVTGAPYSATIKTEFIQTLSDGTHITQSTTGDVARDSQGRTRQDTSLPTIGNLSVADAPHLVFIQDPVSQTSYTLNLTDKTARKMPALPAALGVAGPERGGGKFAVHVEGGVSADGPQLAQMPDSAGGIMIQKSIAARDQSKVGTEDLGAQTMEGVLANGVRTTRTIPAGEMGNDRPITVVTEVWTSPDLKTVVYSKRTDPRMGEQTFQLTNLVRSEPDASLFTIPADFKIVEGPETVIYRSNQ